MTQDERWNKRYQDVMDFRVPGGQVSGMRNRH